MALLLDSPLSDRSHLASFNLDVMGATIAGSTGPVANSLYFDDGALVSRIRDTDPDTYGGKRAEISYVAGIAVAERWFRWEMFVPKDFGPSGIFALMQVHDSPDGGESPVKFPNFVLATTESEIRTYLPSAAPSELASSRIAARTPLRAGRWVRCCLRVQWETTAAGFLEFSYDDKWLVREWCRANHYPDVVGPYLKLGVYDFFHAGGFGERYAKYRALRVYSSGQSHETVIGATPQPQISYAVG